MNKKRPTAVFSDHQDRQSKLAKLNDVLVRLKAQVDWDGSHPVVEETFPVRDPRKGGQPLSIARQKTTARAVVSRLTRFLKLRAALGIGALCHALPQPSIIRLQPLTWL